MSVSPDAIELLDAARRALADEVAPRLSGDARYQVLLAVNAVATAARELSVSGEVAAAQANRVADLLRLDPSDERRANAEALERLLAESIRVGEFDDSPRRDEMLAELRAMTRRTLELTNPKVAARRFGT